MSITFKQEFLSFTNDPETTITYVVHNDGASLTEILQEFRKFLLACGYQPGSIDRHIGAE